MTGIGNTHHEDLPLLPTTGVPIREITRVIPQELNAISIEKIKKTAFESKLRLVNLEIRYLQEKQARLVELIKKCLPAAETNPKILKAQTDLIQECESRGFLAKIAKKSNEQAIKKHVAEILKNSPEKDKILKQLDDIRWVAQYGFDFMPNISKIQSTLIELITKSNLEIAKKTQLKNMCHLDNLVPVFSFSPKAANYLEQMLVVIKDANNHEKIESTLYKLFKLYRTGFKDISLLYEPITEERKKQLENRFSQTLSLNQIIPLEIAHFDTKKEHSMGSVDEYIKHRFATEFTELIKSKPEKCEFFLGSREDMIDFYHIQGYELAGELSNSTSKNLLFYNPSDSNDYRIAFLDVNSMSMLNHISLMLKYSGIPLDQINVRGSMRYQTQQDIDLLDFALKEAFANEQMPKVAVLGPRWWTMEYLGKNYKKNTLSTNKEVKIGDAYDALRPYTIQVGGLRFDYATISDKEGPMCVCAFKMPNGEIARDVIDTLLKNGVEYIVMAGAGGSIDEGSSIGSCQLIKESTYYDQTEILDPKQILRPKAVEFNLLSDSRHVTVDSPLVETKEWERESKKNASSVDVETFHILQAMKGRNVKVIPGLFISDVVGTHPLTTPINVDNAYANLEPYLLESLEVIKQEIKKEHE